VSVKDVDLMFNEFNGQLVSVKNKMGVIPFVNGPVVQDGVSNFKGIKTSRQGDLFIIESAFDKKESYNTLKWTIYPSGWIKLDVSYFPGAYFTNFAGINFSFPEKEIRSVTYMGDGPYRVWKNRMKGNQFGVWTKQYNNTETGESPWIYPEFKGYYSRLYAVEVQAGAASFSAVSATEDLFLHLFTPKPPKGAVNDRTVPLFPHGDLSFLHTITAIGNKSHSAELTGPQGCQSRLQPNRNSKGLSAKLYFVF
ncbi:MAG TPA: glycoside hydrolase family 2, partial [bacterium]|nr:glycoside hydrolase family 2 [bacterium]